MKTQYDNFNNLENFHEYKLNLIHTVQRKKNCTNNLFFLSDETLTIDN